MPKQRKPKVCLACGQVVQADDQQSHEDKHTALPNPVWAEAA